MAISLIQALDGMQDKTPDEIINRLFPQDPFGQWRRCNTLTEDEYNDNRETRIVICNVRHASDPIYNVEEEHAIGARLPWLSDEDYYTHMWDWYDWDRRGTLGRNDTWWFRSQASYNANPEEGFEP